MAWGWILERLKNPLEVYPCGPGGYYPDPTGIPKAFFYGDKNLPSKIGHRPRESEGPFCEGGIFRPNLEIGFREKLAATEGGLLGVESPALVLKSGVLPRGVPPLRLHPAILWNKNTFGGACSLVHRLSDGEKVVTSSREHGADLSDDTPRWEEKLPLRL